jgi:O-Antigen ligase
VDDSLLPNTGFRDSLMMRDALFGLGLLLSTATQLRPGGFPVGPGEICLVLWLGLFVLRQAAQPGIAPNLAFNRVVAFWLILIVAESLGTFVGFTTELFHDTDAIIHDIIAYSLASVLACVAAVELADEDRRRRVTWMIAGFGSGLFVLQVVSAYGWIRIPSYSELEPWYFDRLRGWSKDPNQLGFVAASLVFLSVHLAETATKRWETLAAVPCALLAFAVGLLTNSDSFIAGMMIAIVVFVAMKSWSWLNTHKHSVNLRVASVGLALFSAPIFVAAALPLTPAAIEWVETRSQAVYSEDGQGDLRLDLWSEALEKGFNSGMIGLGPGPHLLIKAWKRPPPSKFEAHNTPLELFTQGGLLAVIVLFWLYASTFFAAFNAKLAGLAALLSGYVIFSMFHFVVRHPIFWFVIVLCLLEAAARNYVRSRPHVQTNDNDRIVRA